MKNPSINKNYINVLILGSDNADNVSLLNSLASQIKGEYVTEIIRDTRIRNINDLEPHRL